MQSERALSVQLRFIDESVLWSWEIRDEAAERVVESGWPQRWAGYPTREEACAAGLGRLDELLGRHDDETTAERFEQCELAYTSREVLASAG